MSRILFVDPIPESLDGLRRSLRAHRGTWDMHYSPSYQDARDHMAAETPADILVAAVENRNEESISFLAAMKEQHPKTVRFSVSSTSDDLLSLQSSSIAHQCLEKPYDTHELEILITRAFTLRERLQGCALRERLHDLDALPSLPALYRRIIEAINSTDTSIGEIAELLQQDISLSAKLLQIVNSAAIGLRNQVTDVAQAATLLGLEKISAMVLAVEVFSMVGQKALPPGFSLDALWSHSIRVAEGARTIAVDACDDRKAIDATFTAGLLHDVGLILLAANFPDELTESLRRAKTDETTLWEAERETFAATHAELGGYLLELWGLPDPIVEAITYHDIPSALPEEEYPSAVPKHGFTPLTGVHVANYFSADERQTAYGCVEGELDVLYMERTGYSAKLEDWLVLCHDT